MLVNQTQTPMNYLTPTLGEANIIYLPDLPEGVNLTSSMSSYICQRTTRLVE